MSQALERASRPPAGEYQPRYSQSDRGLGSFVGDHIPFVVFLIHEPLQGAKSSINNQLEITKLTL